MDETPSRLVEAQRDAAIDKVRERMGFGCVVMGENGSFISAKGIPWRGVRLFP